MKPYALTAYSTLSVFLLSAAITRGDILINEVLINPPGPDESANLEYLEVLSTSGAAEPTDGLTLLLIDSNNGGYGKIRKRWSLDGFSTGSNGLLLIGNNYPSTQPYGGISESTQLADPSSPDSFASGDLGSNGGFTLFLVAGFKPNSGVIGGVKIA